MTFTRENVFQFIRALIVLLIVIAAILVVLYVTPLIYPFIIGWLLAMMLNPFVNFMERRWRTPRWLGVTIALLLFLSIIVTVFTLIVTQLVIEIADLTDKMPTYIDQVSDYFSEFISKDFYLGIVDKITNFYQGLDADYQSKINENVRENFDSFSTELTDFIMMILSGILGFLTSIPNVVTVLVIALLASFFMSKDWPSLLIRGRTYIPTRVRTSGNSILADLRVALFGFVKAQLTLISITGVIVVIGLLILRVDYAFTIGLIAGVVDLLPYLGIGLVFVPWIVYLFFVGKVKLAIGLAILYGIITIMRQILEPKILSSTVGLDPLLTLIALFVGLQLFGFLGLIIGPVSIVIITALIKANVFRDVWLFIKGEPDIPIKK